MPYMGGAPYNANVGPGNISVSGEVGGISVGVNIPVGGGGGAKGAAKGSQVTITKEPAPAASPAWVLPALGLAALVLLK